eukprot:gene18071-19880_t
MSIRRLVEYFAIVGCTETDNLYHGKPIKGTILQRFPEGDQKKFAFPTAVELFCQPAGWQASVVYHFPKFYFAILTDIEGTHSYCGCLLFYEPTVSKKTRSGSRRSTTSSMTSGSITEEVSIVDVEHGQMTYYVPKCLCLVSRQKHLDTLKNCMVTIYAAYAENDIAKLERMIGYAIGCVHLPPPGGPKLSFSLGGDDNQVVYPPLSKSIPTTNQSVAVVFNQLGIHNIILVFTALVTESKLLLLSSSYTHLTLTAQALIALLYPLSFSYVYIPILPSSLLDFLTAPTPFLMGIHMLYKREIPELYDVVTVNIDEGYVTVPDSIHLPQIPEPFFSKTLSTLKLILTPSLRHADMLFPPPIEETPLAVQDKQLRAVFVHLFAEMFKRYRSCLTIIRIHPKPVISFNKIAFLERRGLVADDFFNKVLESVAFSTFVTHRGPPFRACDMFDELVAKADVKQNPESETLDELMSKIQSIADILYDNEPETVNADEITTADWPESVTSENKRVFPTLDAEKIEEYISECAEQSASKMYEEPKIEPQRVPAGNMGHTLTHFINKRRLEVIRDCVTYIFDNKISDARKIFPSVMRALRSKGSQLALCNELNLKIKQSRAMLEHAQFDLVVRLLNASLQDESSASSTMVAAAVLPLACAFFRNLSPGVVQFAFTCLQDQPVWNSHQFWEEAFYMEAQNQVIELYVKSMEAKRKEEEKQSGKVEIRKTMSDVAELLKVVPENGCVNKPVRNSMFLTAVTPKHLSRTSTASKSGSNLVDKEGKKDSVALDEDSSVFKIPAMELAADLLCSWPSKDDEERKKVTSEEESIVYSLAVLFANQMIYLRVPVDAYEQMKKYREQTRKKEQALMRLQANDEGGSIFENMSTRTDAKSHGAVTETATGTTQDGSRSISESTAWDFDFTENVAGYADSVADSVTKFILRFVERVCLEADINTDHIKSLQSLVPGLVSLHMETLNEVYRETKNLAPTQKVKIMKPQLLQGEILQFEGLRCYLMADGRELGARPDSSLTQSSPTKLDIKTEYDMGSDIGGPCLIPAEGAVFLTNYRVIFKGTPVDQFGKMYWFVLDDLYSYFIATTASEMMVTRAFPIGSLVKEKMVKGRFRIAENHTLTECLQMRSAIFQLLKLCFDEEVDSELIESFRKSLQRLRWPQSVFATFAFASGVTPSVSRTLSQRMYTVKKSQKSQSAVASLTKKAMQSKGSLRKHKYALSEDSTKRKYQSVNQQGSVDSSSAEDDDEEEDGRVAAVRHDDVTIRIEAAIQSADRLNETPLCHDYERVGLGSVTKLVPGSPWRLSMVNLRYTICRSYPPVIVTAAKVSDDTLMKIAKNYRLNRFPVAVWRHRKTRGVLLRSGAMNKGVIAAALKAGVEGVPSQGLSSANLSLDEKFFTETVNATSLMLGKGKAKAQSISTGAALSLSAINEELSAVLSHIEDDPSLKIENGTAHDPADIWKPANLYVYCDKAIAKNIKFEPSTKCVFVSAEVHDLYQIKMSFNKLMKVCCPSSATDNDNFFHKLEESKWLHQIANIMQLASSAVNLIDIQGSSCLISLGDGSDATTQITALTQLMLDSHYRTIEGFRVLIEKEWLSFGYKFTHRGNHTAATQSGISPFFLQFLDAVHQIMEQFSAAFEFNNYFLCFLAYHHMSMRFNTFLLESDYERSMQGWFSDKGDKGAGHSEQKVATANPIGQSVWDYIDQQMTRSTIFHNFKYHPSFNKGALQPMCYVSNLNVWDFYTNENLYTGSIYDLEVMSDMDTVNPNSEATSQAQGTAVEVREDWGQCLMGCYGDTSQFVRDQVSFCLNEIYRLREELDQNALQWNNTWVGMNLQQQIRKQTRSVHWDQLWSRHRALALHKRHTMDIVMQGKAVTTTESIRREPGFEEPHNFVLHSFYSNTICNYCLKPIRGINAGLQCTQCYFNVHPKCQTLASPKCTKHESLQNQQAVGMSTSTHSFPGIDVGSRGSNSSPRDYKGKLFKRGHLLRQWIARWYRLDSQQNQLLYYDNEEDNQLKGHIDLGEMRSVKLVPAPPGCPKWADDKAFFELETTKRIHNFLAPDRDKALEWLDRLSNLIA